MPSTFFTLRPKILWQLLIVCKTRFYLVFFQTVGGQTIRIVKKEPDTGQQQHQLSQQAVQQMVQQQQQQAQPQYKIMNPDGTLSDIPASSQPQQVRVIGADGTVTMRLMNPDGTFVSSL